MKGRSTLAALAVAIGSAILFGPLLVPLETRRIFTFEDLTWFHLPMRFLYQRALQTGASMLWVPDLNNGLFLHAEGQVGMAHPFHLAIYRFLPLWAAMNVEMLASYAFAFAGMWGLLRRLSLDTGASLAGAMVFAFCGFNLMHLMHLNAVAIVSHIPWLLWSADVLLSAPAPRWRAAAFAGVSAVLGSELLLGYPQYVWMSAVALVWFAICRTWRSVHDRAVPLAVLAAACVTGVLIGSVQLLPTLETARETFRSATPLAFRLSFSLHPLNLFQLWSPFVFVHRMYSAAPDEFVVPHEFAVYDGGLAIVALVWLVARWRVRRHAGVAAVFAGLFAIALVLALGRYGGAYTLLAHLPGLSSFRAPARHIALMHFALAGVVALVIDDLQDLARRESAIEWRKLWPLAIPLALSVGTLLLGAALRGGAWAGGHGVQIASLPRLAAGLILIAAVVTLFAFAARGWRAAVPLLLVVTALDLAAWGIRWVWLGPPARISAIRPATPEPPRARAGDYLYPRVSLDELNLYPLLGFRSTIAYVGLPPPAILDPADPIAQRLAGVKWAWRDNAWAAVPDGMPRARLVTDVRTTSDMAADVRAIDPRRTALVDAPLTQRVSGRPGSASIVEDRPGRIALNTDAEAPQLLIVTERFHKGWSAREDGRAVRVLPVYGDFLGCVVSPGAHGVTFTFAPASVRIGSWLSVAGVLLTSAASLLLIRIGRARQTGAPPQRRS